MTNKNEILWIKGTTKNRLYEKKGRRTFDEVINNLLDSSNEFKETKRKSKSPFFPRV